MNISTLKKLSMLAFVAGALLAAGASASAQQNPTLRTVTPTFKGQLDTLSPKLRELEQRFNSRAGRLLETKRITAADMDDPELEKMLDEYAKSIKSAFDTAIKEAEEAARSRGARGNVAHLQAFEDVAKAHAATVNRLQARANTVETQIKAGSIQLDREILQRATPQQRIQFQNFLQAPARNELLRQHQDLFQRKGSYPDALRFADLGNEITFGEWMAEPRDWGFTACANWLGTLLVPPAEAAIALPCVGICFAQQWVACAGCVVARGPEAVAAWNRFVRCWNNPGVSGCPCAWWVPNWLCRLRYLAILVGRLA